jgi:hypothetical protein
LKGRTIHVSSVIFSKNIPEERDRNLRRPFISEKMKNPHRMEGSEKARHQKR